MHVYVACVDYSSNEPLDLSDILTELDLYDIDDAEDALVRFWRLQVLQSKQHRLSNDILIESPSHVFHKSIWFCTSVSTAKALYYLKYM